MYVVVIIRNDQETPSVVGPFESTDKAVGLANTISGFINGTVKIALLEAAPKAWESRP